MSKLCSKCGVECDDSAKYCLHCGNSFIVSAEETGYNAQPRDNVYGSTDISFTDAFIKYWRGYVDFSGRARRKEYWYIVLWNLIIGISISLIGAIISNSLGEMLELIYSLATILPAIALCVRRLHDIGKSGLYLLFSFIPVVGWIILLIFFATDSDRMDNQYGKSIKY